ncbi:hypothetical protein IFM89_037584 [Coptis chinensis]|uniref:Uncharacterized protein n=1 Tax=Coptis chinensis TaxID=261450 RepID=A0A835HA06_9MAGN|nr:hypothetical protein IFM89_037584 [Coptis chinensis]
MMLVAHVERGVLLSEALVMHDKWLEDKGINHTNFAVVTWSNWDCRVMLESECRFKRIWKPPYFNRWINLRVPFNDVFGGVRCNLKEAVQLAGLAWEGRAHLAAKLCCCGFRVFYNKLTEMNFLEVDFLFGLSFHLNVTPNTFHTYCSYLHREMLVETIPLSLSDSSLSLGKSLKLHCCFSEDETSHQHQLAV